MAEEATATQTAEPPTSVVNADGSFQENWTDGEAYKADAETLSRYKTLPDLTKSFMDTKRKFGKDPSTLVEIPTENSSDEVKAAFRKARGVPDNVDGYEYALSDEMAVKLGPLRDDLMTKAREYGHKKGWSPQEFKDNLDFYHEIMSDDIDAFGEQTTRETAEAAEKAKAELRKKPGWQSDEEYAAKVQLAQSVMEKYELVDGVADFNLQNSPAMIMGLVKIAESMSEDTLKGLKGSTASNAANIKAQITEVRNRMDEIIKANPSNFKGNDEFKELMTRKAKLYQSLKK